ncbi:MAG: hypothetical protein P9L97_07835 [Candidatus Tenebribacter davisii]|nr:hypothetical protein [Candidatus Tenebribacter davisii]
MGDIWEFTTLDDALYSIQIANIQDSIGVYNGQDVTVEGIITIGTGVLNNNLLNAFIQDNSGKGIMLFDYNITSAYENDKRKIYTIVIILPNKRNNKNRFYTQVIANYFNLKNNEKKN